MIGGCASLEPYQLHKQSATVTGAAYGCVDLFAQQLGAALLPRRFVWYRCCVGARLEWPSIPSVLCVNGSQTLKKHFHAMLGTRCWVANS